ncbi:WD40 repeat domain-containing protein [Actinomadura oligospora]|uniref:WD40 repeat domain-containing protein n=1 Tax=Actinomadura oligospora TaxID=111804 RepID=UPI0004788027|nr:WD40 repeat domain-containing protein [Actinomadura oligospora]
MINSAPAEPPSADDLLCDPKHLVHADPGEVLALLQRATSAEARLAATVYRTSFERHRHVDAVRRRQALSLDASRWGADDLARRIADVATPSGDDPAAATVWNTGRMPNNRLVRRFAGRTERIEALATATVDGRAVAVGAKYINDTVRLWDMATGDETGVLDQRATAVATTTVRGRPILVAGYDMGMQRWDLTTGTKIGGMLRSGRNTVLRITTAVLDGRPVAICCGYDPDPVQIWDLQRGTRISGRFEGHDGLVCDADVVEVDGRTVLVTLGLDHTLRFWDPSDGHGLGEPLECYGSSLAITILNGRPVAVTSGGPDKPLQARDLATRTVVGEPFRDHDLSAPGKIATTMVDGRPVVIVECLDRTLRMWDLAEDRPIGDPMEAHAQSSTALTVGELEGRPVAVTAGRDSAMLLWDISLAGPDRPAGRSRARSTWRVDWATGTDLTDRAALSLPGSTCRTLATGTVEGRAVVVSAGWTQKLRVLDPTTGDQIGSDLKGHRGAVNVVALTTLDGRDVAVSGGDDGTVRIWDLALGKEIGAPLTTPDTQVRALAVAKVDGRLVALSGGRGGGAENEVRVWDLAEGHASGEPLVGPAAEVHAITVTELDGRPVALVASGMYPNDCTVDVWDLTTRRRLGDPLVGHRREIVQVAAATVDGRQVVVTTARDYTARVWDLATRTEARQLPIAGRGSHPLAIGEVGGRPVAVIGGTRRTHTETQMWDLATGEAVGEPWKGHTTGPAAFAFAELHGRPTLVSGDDDSIFVWELRPPAEDDPDTLRPRPGAGAVEVAVAEVDGREVVVSAGGGHLRTWDLAGGTPVAEPIRTGPVSAFAVTELDGRPVAVAAPNEEIVLWDLTDGSEQVRFATDHRVEVIAVALGKEGDREVVVTGTYDNAVSVHELRTGKRVGRRLRSLHYDPVRAATVTADAEGRAVAVTAGGDASAETVVWQVRNGREVHKPRLGDTDDLCAVAVTRIDGRAIAVTAGRDQVVRAWDVSDGSPVWPALAGHTGTITALATTVLDGRPVAFSGSADRTVRVWDLAEGRSAADELVFPHPVTALAATSRGRLVVCFGGDIAVLSREE